MSGTRGDVVVRIRTIAEDMASVAAASAVVASEAASEAASLAQQRARTHPLANSTGSLDALDLLTAVGTASALRESALAAGRRAALAEQTVEDMRRQVATATANRKAAERLVDRRIAAVALEEQRRDQRTIDESASTSWNRW